MEIPISLCIYLYWKPRARTLSKRLRGPLDLKKSGWPRRLWDNIAFCWWPYSLHQLVAGLSMFIPWFILICSGSTCFENHFRCRISQPSVTQRSSFEPLAIVSVRGENILVLKPHMLLWTRVVFNCSEWQRSPSPTSTTFGLSPQKKTWGKRSWTTKEVRMGSGSTA